MAQSFTDKPLLSIKEVIYVIGVIAAFLTSHFRLEKKIDDLSINKIADDKIVAVRLDNLEKFQIETNNSVVALRYRVAILSKETKIEGE